MEKQELMDYIPEIDAEGNIIIDGHVVMYANELDFITKSVREIHERISFSTVVEIGYGLGYTAEQFQQLGVTKHVIIEPNKELFKNAKKWAKNYPDKEIILINDIWQDAVVEGHYDLLYYDAYELIAPFDVPVFDNISADWFAEFCFPVVEGAVVPDDYFRFDDYLQLLVRK